MGKLTIKKVAKISGVNPSLLRAVARQFCDWRELVEAHSDVCRGGANAGFTGFIYYNQTVEFFKRNRDLILENLKSDVESFGDIGLLEFVQSFNCLGSDYELDLIGQTLYGPKSKVDTQIANALAWYALEQVCRAIEYTIEQGE